jgi:sugar O-acyltransferase (sialic acid O-acetyltransferase NeuD family)
MGRETYLHAKQCPGYGSGFIVKGFLDDKSNALDSYEGYPPILGAVESYEIGANDRFICALGDVQYKKKYSEIIKSKGGCFFSLVHSSVIIGATSKIGDGCIISAFSHITADVRIGAHTTIFGFSTIGHDVRIGDYCHLGANSFMGGYSELGDMVILHPGAKVLPFKKVGAGATVGVGSIVMRNVRSGTTVFGSPAVSVI